VTLIDRTNHHLFQRCCTGRDIRTDPEADRISAAQEIFRKQKNTTVIMGEVVGVDRNYGCVSSTRSTAREPQSTTTTSILATGGQHSYFGHDEFEAFAPGLKDLSGAVAIRNKILGAFEQAEAEEDTSRHQELLTFVLVGAGPTGVEMAGAIAVLVRTTLRSQFRRIDPLSARVVLVDMGNRVLGTFSESLSEAARKRLEKLGVEVRLGHGVDQVDAEGVIAAGERIASRTVIWTAGVTPSPAGKWLSVATDRAGRVRVLPDLSVPGHAEVFAIGDTASLDQDGKPLPGVAQVAMQQGRYVGRAIRRRVNGRTVTKPRPFRYFDKGSMAVVGAGFAVLQSHRLRIRGFPAWLAWAAIVEGTWA
jgi:NADH dehydrogenase FAD-containing subunit